MFNEMWRGERDFFYDPASRPRHRESEKAVRAISRRGRQRDDLNYFSRDAEPDPVGHMFVGGGDSPADMRPGRPAGCDYKIENGRYRFARVYNGENWNPQLPRR